MSIFGDNPIVPGSSQNGWASFREYINAHDLGFKFQRKEFKVFSNAKRIKMSTVDNFRNMMVRSGFLRLAERGVYEFAIKVPAGTTTSELHTLAYGSKLVYLEKVVSRKERERRQAEEEARLLELQRVNTVVLTDARSKPCLDCKLPLPNFVKIFSYRQPQVKYHHISQMISTETDKLIAELAKCDLICLNCHAIRLHEGKHSVYQEV